MNNFSLYNSFNSTNDKELILNVIQRGINLMTNNLDIMIFNSWQEYAKSAVKLYSEKRGFFIYNNYLTFISGILGLPPYQQLKTSLDYLLNMVKTT